MWAFNPRNGTARPGRSIDWKHLQTCRGRFLYSRSFIVLTGQPMVTMFSFLPILNFRLFGREVSFSGLGRLGGSAVPGQKEAPRVMRAVARLRGSFDRPRSRWHPRGSSFASSVVSEFLEFFDSRTIVAASVHYPGLAVVFRGLSPSKLSTWGSGV